MPIHLITGATETDRQLKKEVYNMAIIISLYALVLALGIVQNELGSDHREADLGSYRDSSGC